MNYKEIAKDIIEVFFVIFAVTIVGNAVLAQLYGIESIQASIVFGILILSFVTSLANIVFYSRRELKRREMLFRYFIHFVLIFAIVLGFATYAGWIYWGMPITVIYFCIYIFIIYLTVHGVVFLQTKMLADQLNEKLKERYKN